MRALLVLILFALLLGSASAAEAVPPAPPVLSYTVGGELVAVWSDGVLADAQGLRPLWPWPVLCEVSPCRPQLAPGAAVAVVAPDGSASAVVIVPPRGYRLALPVALK